MCLEIPHGKINTNIKLCFHHAKSVECKVRHSVLLILAKPHIDVKKNDKQSIKRQQRTVLDFSALHTDAHTPLNNSFGRSSLGYTSKPKSHHHHHSAWKQWQLHHVSSRCRKDTTLCEQHTHTHHYKAVKLTKYKGRVCKG